MYLSIATTHRPATDLGFLLHKHPERVHELDLTFGKAHVFYPEATDTRCEAVLVIDVDPVGLVRGRGSGEGLLDQYVNDRPYAASSFLSVALNRVYRTAMSGVSKDRPELAASELPLEVVVTPAPARDDALVRALFEPLGWSVEAAPVASPGGAPARFVELRLTGRARLSALLSQLYVLIPVLDDDKHYWVGEDEVGKLVAKGGDWLQAHPARDLIVRRYLLHRRSLANLALARLAPEAQAEGADEAEAAPKPEEALEAPISLGDARMDAVVGALKAAGAQSVVDLGCGEGKLLARLLRERWAQRLIGVDASTVSLQRAARRLKLNAVGGPSDERLTLLHGALTYRDRRWADADAAALVEVIEHLDADRLPALAQVVFGEAKPRTVVVTTPNVEHNARFPNLPPGAFRHPDHRFEWTRAEFRAWARGVEDAFGYAADLGEIGQPDETFGAPTQMAVFRRGAAA
jgi:3' terminal RNA ribose 2'-O-methyltransferase Hen1